MLEWWSLRADCETLPQLYLGLRDTSLCDHVTFFSFESKNCIMHPLFPIVTEFISAATVAQAALDGNDMHT